MTQFIAAHADGSAQLPPDVRALEIADDERDVVAAAARQYLGGAASAREIVDAHGRAEPLVDEVWDAQRARRPITETRLVRLVADWIARGVPFVIWCGADLATLPTITDLESALREIEQQTADQPCDLFLAHLPPR